MENRIVQLPEEKTAPHANGFAVLPVVLVGLLASRGSRRRQRDLRREHDRRRAQAAGRRVGAHYATPRKKR